MWIVFWSFFQIALDLEYSGERLTDSFHFFGNVFGCILNLNEHGVLFDF